VSDALSELELYRTLLSLGSDDRPDHVLSEVLRLAVAATSARLGYVAIGTDPVAPAWWKAHGDDDPEALRARVSHTILATAAEEGEVVVSHDAGRDPRFRDQASVRQHRIEQVICAPVRGGVLYLQGRDVPLPFGARELDLVKLLVRHLPPLLHAVAQRGRWHRDPTQPYRERLEVDGLLGRSEAMARVLARVEQVAPLPVSVLVTGPSGSGKTAVAEAIHRNSPRRHRAFVAVNCASLHPDRLHADLYGAAPGAYTGQRAAREGLVEAAEGGTLFLDEVGELPMDAQAQLLTFLQDRQYRRMAETRQRQADVRVLAASAAALDDPSRFREDLYWRLAAVRLEMPALTQRIDDLPELTTALVASLSRELGCPALPVGPHAMAMLEVAPWPGNVRELRQRLLSALLWAQAVGASSVAPEHLDLGPTTPIAPESDDLRTAVDHFKRRHVERVLEATDGNRTRAAEALGVNRTYLHDLLTKWKVSDSPDTSC